MVQLHIPTVLRNPPIRIKLCVGDVVEIEEESEYTRIKLIIQHKAKNGHYYAFFAFEWFEATNITDPIFGCPLYHFIRSRSINKYAGFRYLQMIL